MGACGRCEADQPVPVLAQAPNRRLLPELPDATGQRGVRINSADVAEVVPVQDHQPGVLGVVRDLGVLPGPTDLQHAVLELLGQDLRRPCASFRDADLRFGFLDQLDKTGLGGEPVAADIGVQVPATTLQAVKRLLQPLGFIALAEHGSLQLGGRDTGHVPGQGVQVNGRRQATGELPPMCSSTRSACDFSPPGWEAISARITGSYCGRSGRLDNSSAMTRSLRSRWCRWMS